MLHPDYQYTPLLITAMASMVAYGVYDVVLGSRIIGGRALRGGMPLYKYISNRLLTAFENLVSRREAFRISHRISCLQPKGAYRTAAAGKLRRLRLRQSDARAMRALRLPHRRSFLPHEIFRRSLVHQFPPQREVWLRRAGHHAAICAAEDRRSSTLRASATRAANWKPAEKATTPRAPKPPVPLTKLGD